MKSVELYARVRRAVVIDGLRQPSENELVGARYQGRKIAETANKLAV